MNSDFLSELGEKGLPEKYLIFRGYSGWGPGQLDDEIKSGAWRIESFDEKKLFQ
jgi:putative transcriptional regulator